MILTQLQLLGGSLQDLRGVAEDFILEGPTRLHHRIAGHECLARGRGGAGGGRQGRVRADQFDVLQGHAQLVSRQLDQPSARALPIFMLAGTQQDRT